MDSHIVHQGKIRFRDSKNNWKTRWCILEKSDRSLPPEDENARNSNYTSLVIRKHKEGEVKLAIPLYYLCVVDKCSVDKKTYGVMLVVANKMDTGETYLIQGDCQADTDIWLNHFQTIVGTGMHKFAVKLPKIVKWKYSGPGYLYFYEEQRFITITDDKQFPKLPGYVGTWPIQLLRRYGGDDPNKFVFEAGRRCFGSVNYYHVASPQAYDIKALCNKVSSTRTVPATGSLANSTLSGYSDNEPRYRHHPGPRTRPSDRPLTIASNSSAASTASKRSSGSSSGGDLFRQQSLDRGVRPPSDTIDSGSGISFRSSNNSILSNRSHSSRGSGSFSDIGMIEDDSGVDTLDSRGTFMTPALDSKDPATHDMYMVMQPAVDLSRTMPPISETQAGPSEVYELMGQQDGYTTLRGNQWQEVQIGESNYMVTKPTSPTRLPQSPTRLLQSPTRLPQSPTSPPFPGPFQPTSPTSVKPQKLINYPAMPSPSTSSQFPCTSDNYMNMREPSPSSGNYMNIDHIPSQASSCYMNVDVVTRGVKSLNLDSNGHTPQLYTNLGHIEYPKAPSRPPPTTGGYGNYMNMTLVNTEESREPVRKVPEQPIYDTPTNHVRAYANMDNKMIAMSVSNPIYGNTAQKLKT